MPHVEQELLTLPEHLSSPSVFSGFVFINDIADNIQSLVRLFADDSSLIFSSTNPLEVEDRLNLDLQVLDNWANKGNNKITELRTILQRESQNS